MPATSSADLATQAANDLTHILQNPAPASPFTDFGTETSIALAQLADIFSQLKPKQAAPPKRKQHTVPPQRAPLDFTSILPPNRPSRPPLDFSAILPPRITPTALRVPTQPPRVPAPSPRVPIELTPNRYTGLRQRDCNGIHIPTQHRYPTRLSHHQTALVNLLLPSSTQQHTSAKYSTAANILAIKSLPQHLTNAINSVIDPSTGASLEYNELIKGPFS